MRGRFCAGTVFLFLSTALLLSSCTGGKKIPGGYVLLSIDGCRNLEYDLGGGNGLGRVDCVSQVGWTDNYMFAASNENYYWFDKTKDNENLNQDEIVRGPLTRQQFFTVIDSLKIKGFEFQVKI